MIPLTHQNKSDHACATFSRAGGDIDAIKRLPQCEDANGQPRQRSDGMQAAAAMPRKRMRSDG
jgi:hypothetical protein